MYSFHDLIELTLKDPKFIAGGFCYIWIHSLAVLVILSITIFRLYYLDIKVVFALILYEISIWTHILVNWVYVSIVLYYYNSNLLYFNGYLIFFFGLLYHLTNHVVAIAYAGLLLDRMMTLIKSYNWLSNESFKKSIVIVIVVNIVVVLLQSGIFLLPSVNWNSSRHIKESTCLKMH